MGRDRVFFVCVCERASVDVRVLEPGSGSTNPQGTGGENWTGITVSQRHVLVTHRETLPVLKESEKDVRCTGGPGVKMKEIMHRYH